MVLESCFPGRVDLWNSAKSGICCQVQNFVISLIKQQKRFLFCTLAWRNLFSSPCIQSANRNSQCFKKPQRNLRCLKFVPRFAGYTLQYSWTSLVAQLVKNLPAMRETWFRSLGWEDPLEKGKATHSSIPAWRIPQTV